MFRVAILRTWFGLGCRLKGVVILIEKLTVNTVIMTTVRTRIIFSVALSTATVQAHVHCSSDLSTPILHAVLAIASLLHAVTVINIVTI